MTSLIKYRIVIDTNVIVSAVVFGGTPLQVLDIVKMPHIDLLMSRLLVDEILALMRRFTVSDVTYEEIRYLVYTHAHMIVPRVVPQVSRDPKDDMLLALSLAGKADYLITGDKDLLILRTFEKTKIVTPREFLSVYRS